MKKIHSSLLIGLLLVATSLFAQTPVAPVYGDGTMVKPYRIVTLDNLAWLSATPSVWNSYFIQTADIDASATATWNGGLGFEPIGKAYPNLFTGNYDGGSHTISNLYINRPSTDYVGFFGNHMTEGEIKNLGLVNVDITGNNYTGGLVGWNQRVLDHCYTTGSITGNSLVGGLVGEGSRHSITNCYSTASVDGSNTIGGLIGRWTGNSLGTNVLENCYSTGAVANIPNSGGLLGASYKPVINCYWDVQTSGQTTSYGDETGKTTAEIKNKSTFSGWDFTTVWDLDGSTNNGYPFFSPPPIPVSNWAIFISIALILVFMLVYKRKEWLNFQSN